MFVADALHAQTIHTQDLTSRGAALLVRVKANQRGLFHRLRALPWPNIPVGDRTRDRGHGRRQTRTCKAVTVAVPGGLGFPHAAQAIRITRTRRAPGTTKRQTAYLIVTLPHDQAAPIDLNLWARLEWHIEAWHWLRDVTLGEDDHLARTGHIATNLAALRNTVISLLHLAGTHQIARTLRRLARDPEHAISLLTSPNPTMN